MGETYDSIGSRVIRHFRHYINGSRHIWLKGDFVDHSMSPKSRSSQEAGHGPLVRASSSKSESLELTSVQQVHFPSKETDMLDSEIKEKPSGVFPAAAMVTDKSHDHTEKSGSDVEDEMVVADSIGIPIPKAISISTSRSQTISVSMDIIARESEERMGAENDRTEEDEEDEGEQEETSNGNKVIEVIPLGPTGNGSDNACDQVDGMTDIFVSTLGRKGQHFLVQESGPSLTGIHIYEGTSRSNKRSSTTRNGDWERLVRGKRRRRESEEESTEMDSNTDR